MEASCSLVYQEKENNEQKNKKQNYRPTIKGKGTQSPEEPLFKAFAAAWKHVDKSDYKVFNAESREQADASQYLVLFLLQWLENGESRHDYRELAELAILFLAGYFLATIILYSKHQVQSFIVGG